MQSPAQVEARVLELVDAIRRGERIEDDLVECKREWPGIEKARQLAGSANSAHGSPLLILVGVDEDAGVVVPVDDTDPADWWSRISARFDQDTPPMLERHLRIHVGDGQAVVALLFSTDRAPYLVKVGGGGSPEREIPVRVGTRTRSARRDEVLRMLSPAILVPPITVLYTEVHSTWHSARKPVEDPGHVPDQIRIDGRSTVYIEHTGRDIAVLPKHVMSASLHVDNLQIPLDVDFYGSDPVKHPPRQWGVQTYDDQITCTAPGTAILHLGATVPTHVREVLARTGILRLSMTLGVVGSPRSIRLDETLKQYSRMTGRTDNEYFQSVNAWSNEGAEPPP